jgi:Family of unknown function (DUF6062)
VDIFTYEIETALQGEGCPLCRAVTLDERRWMETFVREGHRDPGARRAYLSSGGFCSGHAQLFWAVARAHDSVPVVASLSLRLAEQEIARSGDRRRAGDGSRLARWLRRPGRQAPDCPACVARKLSDERKCHFLCVSLAAEETRARYAASAGLCVPHFRLVMTEAALHHPDVAAMLSVDQLRRLRNLRVQLREFDRKLDHRYRREPPGTEQQAPREALVRFAGRPVVRDAFTVDSGWREGNEH